MKLSSESRERNPRKSLSNKQELKIQRRAFIYTLNHLLKETFDSKFREFMREKDSVVIQNGG